MQIVGLKLKLVQNDSLVGNKLRTILEKINISFFLIAILIWLRYRE